MFCSCLDCKNFELRNSIAFCKKNCFTSISIFYAPPHTFVRVCDYYSGATYQSYRTFGSQFNHVLKKLKQFQEALKDVVEATSK